MHITMILLQSLDGFLSRRLDDDLSWGTKEDKNFFRTKSKEIGCMVMGSSTFENMPFPLAFKKRHTYVMTSSPQRYAQYTDSDLVTFLSGTPADVVAQAEADGYSQLAVVGGGKINSAFIRAGLMNTIFITIAPHIFGYGIPAFGSEYMNAQLKLESVQKLTENEILCEYSVLTAITTDPVSIPQKDTI